jgi:hypothetical protein
MEFEAPKRHCSLTWFNMVSGGRGKRGALVGKGRGPWHRNVAIINSQ